MTPRCTLARTCLLAALVIPAPARSQSVIVRSPDGRTTVVLALSDGRLTWAVTRYSAPVVMQSRLGFTFRGAPPFETGLRLADSARSSGDATFTLPLGETARVRDRHNELRVTVAEAAQPNREMWVVVRAFDDGLGFRYELPDQPNLKGVDSYCTSCVG
ncbi:MAG: glycoside hydrolase family 97 N-terminal domain-containing protein [Gemmatimonadota bacterium]